MKTFFVIFFALCWSAAGFCAQALLPIIHISPEDVDQTSIEQGPGPSGTTNKFTVRWKYTEAGAKKMLAFWREHAGQKVLEQVGDFESQPIIGTAKPPSWTEEGWLKWRTDKFVAVSAEDAKKIIAGLKSK